jgi:alkylation response protein AidB-like acyl-CoA dehydrogenase
LPAPTATYTIVAPVALAIAAGAITELRQLVATKMPLGSMKTARDRGAVRSAVAEAEATLQSARLFYKRSPLERHFRDAETVRHHGFVSDSRLETVGQVYLGVPPEFPFVAF